MNKNKFITSARKSKSVQSTDENLYTFIILSDTHGYRMKSYGPTSLMNFKKCRLIDVQIQAIVESFKKYEIIICCGSEVEKVYKHIKINYPNHNIRIVENQVFNNSNSCESMRISINNTSNEKIYIIDGRLLINSDLFKEKLEESYVYMEKNPCENLEVGLNINEYNHVEHFSYGAKNIWSEIAYIGEKNTLDNLRKIVNNIDFKNKFIFEAMNELLKMKKDIKYVVNQNPIEKINNIKTYHLIKEKI